MIDFIIKKYRFWKIGSHNQARATKEPIRETERSSSAISKSLKENLSDFKKVLGTSADIKIHEFVFGENFQFCGALIFIDGMVSNEIITESIMKPLIMNKKIGGTQTVPVAVTINNIKRSMICSGDIIESGNSSELIKGCLSGDTVLLIEGFEQGLIISSKGWEKRSVTEPQTASVVRGPREGFTENFRTNTALIRRKIKNSALRMDHMTIGEKTATNVCVVYLNGVANPELIKTIQYRLNNIHVDSILESGYIEQYIEDSPFSIFPTIGNSEKPDVVAAKILEGRAAIIVDGTPFVLTVPLLFLENFQTSEDYYTRTIYSSLIRILRYLSFIISTFAPAFYIALTTFHQELIPTTLLFTIAEAREGTPFPAFIEACVMVLAFEILREAGLRLPRPIGQAVSIVGALIMGDAAVSAGLVGAPMVITIAITAVSGFVIPDHGDAMAILRFLFMILAATMGGYGIAIGFLGLLVHLASLKSFGVPYFSGIAPARIQSMEDTFIRMPLWAMTMRPKETARGDMTRKEFLVPPAQPSKEKVNQSNSQEDAK